MSCFVIDCRYGRVQSVKLLPRTNKDEDSQNSGGGGGGGGVCAAVAFMDIKSAAKAHASENSLDDRNLVTDYYEPLLHAEGGSGGGAVTASTTLVAPLRSSRYSNHDDVVGGGGYERGSSHFFERRGADADGAGASYLRRQQAPNLHYRDRQGLFPPLIISSKILLCNLLCVLYYINTSYFICSCNFVTATVLRTIAVS